MSGSATLAPSLANPIAYALPIFPPPPVMITDLFSNRIWVSLLRKQRTDASSAVLCCAIAYAMKRQSPQRRQGAQSKEFLIKNTPISANSASLCEYSARSVILHGGRHIAEFE